MAQCSALKPCHSNLEKKKKYLFEFNRAVWQPCFDLPKSESHVVAEKVPQISVGLGNSWNLKKNNERKYCSTNRLGPEGLFKYAYWHVDSVVPRYLVIPQDRTEFRRRILMSKREVSRTCSHVFMFSPVLGLLAMWRCMDVFSTRPTISQFSIFTICHSTFLNFITFAARPNS